MDVNQAIRRRYSCRTYQDRAVDPATLQALFECARWAPSARNIQEWRFVVVTDAEKRAALAKIACDQAFVGTAPVVIACCAANEGRHMRCGQISYPIDVAIIIDHLTLLATERGLGTCWIGAFHEREAKALLGIPEEFRVVELLTLGYPAGSTPHRERLPVEEILRYEHW